VPVRLTVVGGSGQIDMDGTRLDQKGGKTSIASTGWETTKVRYTVEIVGGSKAVEVIARP
jgi:hypothetical protein